MKIGTDALLLGSWSGDTPATQIIEVGCGCGVISLMMAQRFSEAEITALDIDPASVKEASENFSISPFAGRLKAIQADYREFAPEKFADKVLSNPPFFINSLKAPDIRRHQARHQEKFDAASFFSGAFAWTKPEGQVEIIVPYENFQHWVQEAKFSGWYVQLATFVQHTAEHPVSRVLLRFEKHRQEEKSEMLRLKENDEHSENYRKMMHEFLLNFGFAG